MGFGADFPYWRCPDCSAEIGGETVADKPDGTRWDPDTPTFAELIEAHEETHVARAITVELSPDVLDFLNGLKGDQGDPTNDSIHRVVEELRRAFEQPIRADEPPADGDTHPVLIPLLVRNRLEAMGEQMRSEARLPYATICEAVVRAYDTYHDEGDADA